MTTSPAETLKTIAFMLERLSEATHKVKAFRRAAEVVEGLDPSKFDELIKAGRLQSLDGIGASTEKVILEAAKGETPEYAQRLAAEQWPPFELGADAVALHDALIGDCHTHSTWSDGGSSIIEMARTARGLGREYMVLTDHSPRLKVANGLTTERLMAQHEELITVNDTLHKEAAVGHAEPFIVKRGIEVDILEDGALDQDLEVLENLDMVVASVHSKLRMDGKEMTRRMVAAVADPNVDILGHCTGRMLTGNRKRPQSDFDARAVFQACIDTGTAVEINSRPERCDPPEDLLALAVEMGCMFSIDSDAHAPGQLDFLVLGAMRGAACGVTADRVINARSGGC